MGQLMTSFRSPEDKAWNYVRPLATTKPFLRFVPAGEGLYEVVVLDGLPTKVMANSDDPPNSYYTRDTFVPHPVLPDAWKYIGRLDDRVTLVNGEKVLPIPYEHQIRQSELVKDCLVFGVGRAFPGLFIMPSDKVVGMNKSQLVDELQPIIDLANERAEKFGYISREMIEVLDTNIEYPQTDKGTIIRAASYKKFAELIDAIYTRFETPDEGDQSQRQKFDLPGLQSYIAKLFNERVRVKGLDLDTDLFAVGMDSLQAIATRGHIMREVDLGDHVLGQNCVFEHPSIRQLAQYLDSLCNGSDIQKKDEIEIMRDLVDRNSDFKTFVPGSKVPDGDVVVSIYVSGLCQPK
jgi:hypothetical protein